jgi:putative transcriptional regulator
MTIRWRLVEILEAREWTPYRLAKETGLSVPSAYALAKREPPAALKASTLELLCKALDCQPGDLLEYRKR